MIAVANFQDKANFIWQVADDILRGNFKNYEYGEVVLPFVVLRRLDCVLEPTKDAVVAAYKQYKDVLPEPQLAPILLDASGGHKFYNTSLSTCDGFPWSRPILPARKTVFNLVAADNHFEKSFARFLEDAPDVERFAKLPSRFGFAISYTDSAANLRYYEPDFVVVTAGGIHHLVETKGREDIDVRHKDRAAQLWCENATVLTGMEWQYRKVLQKGFEELRPDDFEDLIALEPVTLL